jgi:hypothetical protein
MTSPTGNTNDKNPSGQGKSVGDAFLAALIAAAVALLVEVIKDLANALQGRSIVGSISNNTKDTLQLVTSQHDHGGFKQTPPQTIAPNTAAAFSSQQDGFLTGTQGSVTYAGNGYTATFSWDNPEIGNNSADTSKDGQNSSRVLVAFQAGSGNEGALMNYWLFPHPDYSVKSTLSSQAQGGVISVKSLGTTPISLRDLVSNPP